MKYNQKVKFIHLLRVFISFQKCVVSVVWGSINLRLNLGLFKRDEMKRAKLFNKTYVKIVEEFKH